MGITQPGGGEDGVGCVVVIAGEWGVRAGAEAVQRGIEGGGIADLAEPFAYAGRAGGDGGVDFNDEGAVLRHGIKRPHGHAPTQAVEHPHAREAGFPDLGGADKVEAARRGKAHLPLGMFTHTHAAKPAGEKITAIPVKAKMPLRLWMPHDAVSSHMLILGTKMFHKLPKRGGIPGRVGPAREIGPCINEGKCGGKVYPNERRDFSSGEISNPIQNVRTRPATVTCLQYGRVRAEPCNGERQPLGPGDGLPRPINGDEVGEPMGRDQLHFFRLYLSLRSQHLASKDGKRRV